jgi:AsmA-like C-terminal region
VVGGEGQRAWLWVAMGSLAIVLLGAGLLEILLHHAEPILRARIMQSLSARFHSRVELRELDVSLLRGFEVSGSDLAIYPYNINSGAPTISVRQFSFRTGYASLVHSPLHIGHVEVEGLRISLPPKSQRTEPAGTLQGEKHFPQKITVFVEEVDAKDTVLTLGTDRPGRLPTQFVIQALSLKSVGPGKPLNFTATLTNPKPVGQIETHGYFGPWNAERPGDTVLGGDYSFHDADLGTIKGIGGILSSKGSYRGALDKIVIDGETDTPDFEVKVSGHKVPLHTEFHAIVNGTDGDVWLQPVKAQFLHSFLVAQGDVVRVPMDVERGTTRRSGRRVQLDVVMDQARIEDLLRLAVRTDPPVMSGQVRLRTKMDLPPGVEDVAHRLRLQGNFAIVNGRFTSDKIQNRIDEISLRSRGQIELAAQQARDNRRELVRSQLQGDFNLANAALNLANLRYDIPGAKIRLAGTYTLDGAKFNFAGTADMQATVSRMVGGWRGLLLMPFDRIFQKNGAGTEVPFKINGTKSDPQFGLDLDRLKKK